MTELVAIIAGPLSTLVGIAALWINLAQARERQRLYLDTRLSRVEADIAKIFGWLEGQRDQRISQPDIPPR